MEKIIEREATVRVAGECYKRVFLENLHKSRIDLIIKSLKESIIREFRIV